MRGGGIWDAIQRVVVIVGCQRSGTTLTGQIIGAHPEAFLVDELDGLYPWFHAHAQGLEYATSLADAMLQNAKAKYRSKTRANFVAARDPANRGATTLVLKAPNLTYDFDRIAALPAQVSVVYPVRDPRAVVASMRRLGHIDFVANQLRLLTERPAMRERFAAEHFIIEDEAQPSWIRQAAVWSIKSSIAPFYEKSGLTVTQFKYEDLVCEPDRVISAILTGCCLRESDETRCAHRIYIGHGPGGTDRTRAIDAASLSSSNAWLDSAQQAHVMRTVGAWARNFGYV
jgi:protein-tyrosine sulfotransferase